MSLNDFVPTIHRPKNELADYIEIQCILNNGKISYQEIKSCLEILQEEDHSDGVAEFDPSEPILDDIFNEFETRKKYCNSNYPFILTNKGYTISVDNGGLENICSVYHFMLFATRVNMKDNKIHNNLDGTKLFEGLSEHVARNYFGDRAESLLFGTSNRITSFEERIELLINRLGEGYDFSPAPNTSPTTHKDDGLDVAVWKSFSDMYGGKLIGFGQCKTGQSWRTEITKLNPDGFCSKWFKKNPSVLPVKMFFITEGTSKERWYEYSLNGGIIFDRFRIMDFLPKIDDSLLLNIKRWNEGVISTAKK